MKVRTRFAPSPTGFLHVGGVRTALFAWLVAKQGGGQFILRIEDTDKVREVEGSEQHIMDSLRWLGLEWDEGPDKNGPHKPYRQSERLDIYKQWAEKLIESGRAYWDVSSAEDLDKLRKEAVAAHRPFLFRDHRPEQTPSGDFFGTHPLRFKSEPKAYKWQDEVMGDLSTGPEVVDDFILIKSDGYPTYNFAHIIDDHLMDISHVIRSQEFVSSVPKFLNLYDALGFDWPVFATLPYVLGPDGKKKLSKRDGAKDILDYQKEGYLPETLLSFLATLGWNDGTTQEIYTRDELVEKFKLERVQKSGAKFDEQRLSWINGSLIRELDTQELAKKAADFWPNSASTADQNYKLQVLELVKERLKYLSELSELTQAFFEEPYEQSVKTMLNEPSDKLLKDKPLSEIKLILQASVDELAKSDFTQEDIKTRLNELLDKLQTKPGVLFPIIRIGVTGQASSPEIFGTLHVLGKEKTLARLHKALALLDS
jgi:glutamyl-tRNA synthetase